MDFKKLLLSLLTFAIISPAVCQDIVITAIFDGSLTGGNPRGLELYVINDIPDLSVVGIGIADNGGGSDGQEYTFPADAATAGDFIYIVKDAVAFNDFFGVTAQYTSGLFNFNGDDPVELFQNGVVIDVYGDVALDGSGLAWEYLDGYSYRVSGTGPETIWDAANWILPGINIYDPVTTNGAASTPMPIGTYSPSTGGVAGCTDNTACNYDATATINNGSCLFEGDSCDDGDATTVNDVYLNDCSCAGEIEILGCTDSEACNYDITATTDDSSCDYSCIGCMNSAACNYDATATIDSGACILVGDACDDGDALTANDVIQGDCSCAGIVPTLTNALVITAIFDGPLSGGVPKGVELYALADIADLSTFGIGSASNGGASAGVEFTFPADALTAGEFIFVSSDDTGAQAFFASSATNYNAGSVMGINGDDVIELFEFGQLIDSYGEVGVDGTGEAWEYLDTYATRKCSTGPDGAFNPANWTFGTLDVFDGIDSSIGLNSDAAEPMPVAAYLTTCPSQVFGCTNNAACNYDVTATDDDGSCILPGDACDDADSATENDVIQGDCSCAGTAITFCSAPVWTPADVVTNSGSTGGSWISNGTGFDVNGFCGGGCIEAVDTWIVSNGFDYSGVVTSTLTFDATEAFGTTDLLVQYTTSYNGDPSASTWTAVASVAAAGGISIDLSALAGQSEVYLGIQYADDALDGFSGWSLSNINLSGDCPTNVTVYDCPTEQVNFGDACDDGDAATINDIIQGDCTCAGTIPTLTNALVITAIFDGPISGGTPKGVELYALADIVDLSNFGIGSASNGGASAGVEFTFPADALTEGEYIFVTSDDTGAQTFFASSATNYNAGSVMGINGDDVIELFEFGQLIDSYGEVGVDGTGEAWEYTDTYATRKCATGPDGAFNPANWTFGALDLFDGIDAITGLNTDATEPMPVAAYLTTCPSQVFGCTNDTACNYDVTATDDDGSCILPGDACDDGNALTETDVIQPDCSCAGTAVTVCDAPIFTPVDVTTNSGSTGGTWQFDGTAYSVNGFCGGGCVEAVDTWIVSNGYDFSAVTASNLLFNASENFGTTDLDIQYTTAFNGDPTLSTWTSLLVIADAGGYTIDLSALAGLTEVYLGVQYLDDAVDGFSSWTLTDVNLSGDCPTNITVYDCPAAQANFGDACDDLDPLTINDVIQPDCSCAGETFTLTNGLVITAVYDGPLTGGAPKGVELYALIDIDDLQNFGIGSANNGGGSDGVEFTFPEIPVQAGDYIFVSSDELSANAFFESASLNLNAGSAMSINGDDAIELFEFGQVIDTFGDINTDGTGTTWEYLDSYATRNCSTGPDGATFVEANWSFGAVNVYDALDPVTGLNSQSTAPMAVNAYAETCPTVLGCTDVNACNYNDQATDDDGSCLLPVANCSQCNGQTLEIIDTDGDGICDADEPVVSSCPADITGDGLINVDDFLALLSVFGTVCE